MSGNRPYRIALGVLLLLFTAAVGLVGVARAPWWDEAAFADPAYNLAFHGVFGSTTWHPLIPGLPDFPHIDRYTYWMMPLYSVTLSGWFTLFGFSIYSMHFYSLAWGVLLVAGVYLVVASLAGHHGAALLAAALTAVNTSVVYSASTGRPDCMTASLGMSALATYVTWRERHMGLALCASWLIAAACVLTHPLGLIHAGVLCIAILMLDRRRLRFSHAVLIVSPILIAALSWALYIAKAPDVFRAQFSSHVGDRLGGVLSPLMGIFYEIQVRYAEYFLGGPGGLMRLRLTIPLAYCAAYGYLLLAGRRSFAAKVMLALVPVAFIGLSTLDGMRYSHYLVHVFPLYSAMCAVAVWCAFQRSRKHGQWAAGLFAFVICFQAAIVVHKTRDTARKKEYDSMVRTIERTAPKSSVIMGAAEFMFGLGREYRLVDDARLGFYSGLRPDFLVRGYFQPERWFLEKREPDVIPYVTEILDHHAQLIAENESYRFYKITEGLQKQVNANAAPKSDSAQQYGISK